MKQFEDVSSQYADFVAGDAFRNYLHYPAILDLVTNSGPSRVLDVGCGDGLLARLIRRSSSAEVWAYDSSPGQIARALGNEKERPLGIYFTTADHQSFQCSAFFDLAVSVMVLPYAGTTQKLQEIFSQTAKLLPAGSLFASIVFSPWFDAYGKKIGSRRFLKLPDSQVQVQFLTSNQHAAGDAPPVFTSVLRQFQESEYGLAAQRAGFTKISWASLSPNEAGIHDLGQSFWRTCRQYQPYRLFIARK